MLKVHAQEFGMKPLLKITDNISNRLKTKVRKF